MESFPPKLVKLWSGMVQQITTQRLQNMESFTPKLVKLWSGMVQQITTQRHLPTYYGNNYSHLALSGMIVLIPTQNRKWTSCGDNMQWLKSKKLAEMELLLAVVLPPSLAWPPAPWKIKRQARAAATWKSQELSYIIFEEYGFSKVNFAHYYSQFRIRSRIKLPI